MIDNTWEYGSNWIFDWELNIEDATKDQLFELIKEWSSLDMPQMLNKIKEYSDMMIDLDSNTLLRRAHYLYWMVKACENDEFSHLFFAITFLLNFVEALLIDKWFNKSLKCYNFLWNTYRDKKDCVRQKIDSNRKLIDKFWDKISPYLWLDPNMIYYTVLSKFPYLK